MELSIEGNNKKQGLSEERLAQQLPNLRHLISFFREYPDYFIDYMKVPNRFFKFYFY